MMYKMMKEGLRFFIFCIVGNSFFCDTRKYTECNNSVSVVSMEL